jgi:hypothetical protein
MKTEAIAKFKGFLQDCAQPVVEELDKNKNPFWKIHMYTLTPSYDEAMIYNLIPPILAFAACKWSHPRGEFVAKTAVEVFCDIQGPKRIPQKGEGQWKKRTVSQQYIARAIRILDPKTGDPIPYNVEGML